MDAHETVVHEVDRRRVNVILQFLLDAFVKRVIRRIPLRIEKF